MRRGSPRPRIQPITGIEVNGRSDIRDSKPGSTNSHALVNHTTPYLFPHISLFPYSSLSLYDRLSHRNFGYPTRTFTLESSRRNFDLPSSLLLIKRSHTHLSTCGLSSRYTVNSSIAGSTTFLPTFTAS